MTLKTSQLSDFFGVLTSVSCVVLVDPNSWYPRGIPLGFTVHLLTFWYFLHPYGHQYLAFRWVIPYFVHNRHCEPFLVTIMDIRTMFPKGTFRVFLSILLEVSSSPGVAILVGLACVFVGAIFFTIDLI